MNKARTTCKDCIANHYWRHMGDTDRCFFKVMMSNFKEKLVRYSLLYYYCEPVSILIVLLLGNPNVVITLTTTF
jgi:hypothetical protein